MEITNNTTASTANTQSPKRSESPDQSESPKGARKKQDGSEGDFSQQLSAVAQPQPQVALSKAPATPVADFLGSGNTPALKDPARNLSISTAADRSPVTRSPAASLNTAAAITGLKPWSREWVLEGNDPLALEAGAAVKPLFGEGAGEPSLAELVAMADAMAKAEATAQGQSPRNQAGLAAANPAPLRGMEAAQAAPGLAPAGLALNGGTRGNAGAKVDRAALAAEAMAAAGTGHEMNAHDVSAEDAILSQPGNHARMAQAVQSSAQHAQGTEGLQSAMHRMGLNGEILAAPGAQAAQVPSQLPQAQALSGADFMSALAATRMGARDQGGAQSNLSGDSSGGGSGFANRPALRSIDGGRSKTLGLEGKDDYALLSPMVLNRHDGQGAPLPPPTVDGHVTEGSMTRNRLTSESLLNMTNEIRGSALQGGGEMRVRLKPDNLGELHVRVLTRGNDVRLQIQASDEHARKILEESLPHLKEKLASQNLNLGRVEVSLAHSVSQLSQGGDSRQDSSSQNQNNAFQQHSMNDWMGRDGNAGRQGQGGYNNPWADSDAWEVQPRVAQGPHRAGVSALTGGAGSSAGRSLESGRLDVRA
jgi:hypothetical protein